MGKWLYALQFRISLSLVVFTLTLVGCLCGVGFVITPVQVRTRRLAGYLCAECLVAQCRTRTLCIDPARTNNSNMTLQQTLKMALQFQFVAYLGHNSERHQISMCPAISVLCILVYFCFSFAQRVNLYVSATVKYDGLCVLTAMSCSLYGSSSSRTSGVCWLWHPWTRPAHSATAACPSMPIRVACSSAPQGCVCASRSSVPLCPLLFFQSSD